MKERTPKLVKLLLGLFVVVLVAGHLAYWYRPRERPAVPTPADLPGELLVSREHDVVLWLPYPHQNLGALARSTGDLREYLAALARLAGLPEIRIPSFGPFVVPPARELALALDGPGDGEEGSFLLAARVYPAVAWLGKGAGWLAANPWLAEGEPERRGRRFRVSWEGTLWRVESSVPGEPGRRVRGRAGRATAMEPPQGPVLMALHLARPLRGFPTGLYLLRREGEDLVLGLQGGANRNLSRELAAEAREAVVLLVVTTGVDESATAPTALALFTHAASDPGDIPSAAVLFQGRERRWSLPGEALLAWTGRNPYRGSVGDWRWVAVDRRSHRLAAALAPQVAMWLEGGDRHSSQLRLGIWLRPGVAAELAHQAVRLLESLPLLGHEEVERWRDLATLLGPLAPWDEISLSLTGEPAGFELGFHRGGD